MTDTPKKLVPPPGPKTLEFNIIEITRARRSGRQDERYEVVSYLNKQIAEASSKDEPIDRLKHIRDHIKNRTLDD